MYTSLQETTKVEFGYASIRDVQSSRLEDHMHSFFLAETCKYLYLLFDTENFLHSREDFVFTTEGHLFPVDEGIHRLFRYRTPNQNQSNGHIDPVRVRIEPKLATCKIPSQSIPAWEVEERILGSDSKIPCTSWDNPNFVAEDIRVSGGEGSFLIETSLGEFAVIRHLGTPAVEVVNRKNDALQSWIIPKEGGGMYRLELFSIYSMGFCCC